MTSLIPLMPHKFLQSDCLRASVSTKRAIVPEILYFQISGTQLELLFMKHYRGNYWTALTTNIIKLTARLKLFTGFRIREAKFCLASFFWWGLINDGWQWRRTVTTSQLFLRSLLREVDSVLPVQRCMCQREQVFWWALLRKCRKRFQMRLSNTKRLQISHQPAHTSVLYRVLSWSVHSSLEHYWWWPCIVLEQL